MLDLIEWYTKWIFLFHFMQRSELRSEQAPHSGCCFVKMGTLIPASGPGHEDVYHIPPFQLKTRQQLIPLAGKEEVLLFPPFSTLPRYILRFPGYGYISKSFDTNGADQHIKVLGLFMSPWDIFWGFPGVDVVWLLGEMSLLQVTLKLFEGKLWSTSLPDWKASLTDPPGSAPLFFCPFHTADSTTSASPPPGPQLRTTTVAIPPQLAEPASSLTTAEQIPPQI